MKRGLQYVLDNQILPANAMLTTAQADLTASIAHIETIDGERETGTGRARGAVVERRLREKALRSSLADLSFVARTLNPIVYADVAAQLKMGRLSSFAALIAHTKNAIAVVTPIKQVFTDRGAATTVVEDLQAQLAAFEATLARRYSGLGTQVGHRFALEDAIRTGMKQLRAMDAILTQLLKATPEKLGEWKAAKRVEQRQPATKKKAKSGTPKSSAAAAPAAASTPAGAGASAGAGAGTGNGTTTTPSAS